MAIKGQDQNNNSTQMGQAMAQARQQAGNPIPTGTPSQPEFERRDQPRTGGNQFNWRSVGSLFDTPFSRNPQSEVLTSLQKAIEEQYAKAPQKLYKMTVIPVDMNQDNNLSLSILIICAQHTQRPDLGVAYHTLILEGSGDPFAPVNQFLNGQNVEILRVAGDANDGRLANIVLNYVTKQFPDQEVWNADAEVVPRDFKIEDQKAVFTLATNAGFAATHELRTKDRTFGDINLANASKEDTLQVKVAFPKVTMDDAVGLPVRADVALDLNAVPANQGQQQQAGMSPERTSVIARSLGFVDLIYTPEAMPTNPYTMAYQQPQQQQQAPRLYTARLVLTQMESQFLQTLPAQLLTLVNALALRENNAWMSAFRPAPFREGDIDIHDIGAIGYELKLEVDQNGIGRKIETKGDAFNDQQLGLLMAAAVKPGLVLSMDIDECGPNTWFNGVFMAAASGRRDAIDAIIRGANHLTNGLFDKHFAAQGGGLICTNEDNRIHRGYYFDRKGERKDLREIDYLAVLNLAGAADPELIQDWSSTFNRVEFPLPQRLAQRRRILESLAPGHVITGFATRVTFEAPFLNALAEACKECGLDVRSITPYNDTGRFERAAWGFGQNTVLAPTASGLFNRGYAGNQQAQGNWNNRTYTRRF